MLVKFISEKSTILLIGLVLMFGADHASYAQKGHGNGNGHGNNGGGKHDRGDNGRGNDGDRQKIDRQQAPSDNRGDHRGNGNGRKEWKNNRTDDRRVNEPTRLPPVIYGGGNGGGWVPPGQIRRQQVHERNEERKALKDQEKEYRRINNDERHPTRRWPAGGAQYGMPQWFDQISRTYRTDGARQSRRNYDVNGNGVQIYTPRYPYSGSAYGQYAPYYPGGNGAGYYSYPQNQYSGNYEQQLLGSGSSWKTTLLRTLIGSVLSGFGGNNGYSNAGPYDQYYGQGPVAYSRTAYYSNSYAPQYASYRPAYGQSAYGPDYSDYGGLLSSLPTDRLFGTSSGAGGYISEMLADVVAQGYLQGLTEGQIARDNRYSDRYYNDPYVAENGAYDQSSYTIAENRRLLSEGYELGYADALNGQSQFEPRSAGNLDLVNILLGNIFRIG